MSNPSAVDALADGLVDGIDNLDDEDFAAARISTATAMLLGVASAMSIEDRKKMADDISLLILTADAEAMSQ